MLVCPKCGHVMMRKGWRKRKGDAGRIAYCKICKQYFTLNPARPHRNVDAEEIMKAFLRGRSIRDLARELGLSASTVHRKLQLVTKQTSWESVTAKLLESLGDKYWYKNLVVDTTNLKVEGRKLTYLHAADNHLQQPLIYKLIPEEAKEYVSPELSKLRELGYYPDLTTIDGSGALKSAVEENFDSPVQLCLVHLLRNLKEKLKIEAGEERWALIREEAKNLILHTACALDREAKDLMRDRLEQFTSTCEDIKTLKAVKGFLKDQQCYHSLEELKGHPEAWTTNLAENHIKYVKIYLRGRLFGFKSMATAEKHISMYWQSYVQRKQTLQINDFRKCLQRGLNFLSKGHVSLEGLANILKINYNELVDIARKKGLAVIAAMNGHHLLSHGQIKRILRFASEVTKVGELAQIMNIDPYVVYNVIRTYGRNRELNYDVKVDGIYPRIDWDHSQMEKAVKESKITVFNLRQKFSIISE